jgi:glycerol-3-phosphate dehydrogenase
LRVVLVDQGDLASATSSASSKLVHGGLRYLEHGEIRLVTEALREREVLLRAAPHIVHAMRFVLPQAAGQRPAWMIRIGLLAYDWLARRQTLPASGKVALEGFGLKSRYSVGFIYSDCRVDDARLVIANAKAAEVAGARIMPGTRFIGAERGRDHWRVRLSGEHSGDDITARVLVNAAGRWVDRVLALAAAQPPRTRVRLVQGSHIVVPRRYDGDHAFILQNEDRRVTFVYPYEGAFTLIGTTDVEIGDSPENAGVQPQEIEYLCRAANRYLEAQVQPADVIWSYSGVRALVDDGYAAAPNVTRDYLLDLDARPDRAPILSVFGGKITTYRKLAERALEKLAPSFPNLPPAWTESASLPGGNFVDGDVAVYIAQIRARYPAIPAGLLSALVGRHGTLTPAVLGETHTVDELGEHFGADLYAREVDYFRHHEWARHAEDVLWRRTKAGLHLSSAEQAQVRTYLEHAGERV